MSLMYSKKSIGPRTEPSGTPDVTSVMSDRAPLTETRCLRFDRKDVIQLCVLPVIPYEVNLDRRRLCGTLSKALAKSRRLDSPDDLFKLGWSEDKMENSSLFSHH